MAEARRPDLRTPLPPNPGDDQPQPPRPPMVGMSWRRFLVVLAALFALN